jgi:ATP-dependent Clp protease adaptor protein ClpS
MTVPTEPVVLPDIQIEVAPDVDAETQLDPPTRVLLHNDDVTTMEFVVMVLRSVFELAWLDAERVMLEAHFKGYALVGVYPLEEAKYKVGQAHALARAEGFPLRLTIEPDE